MSAISRSPTQDEVRKATPWLDQFRGELLPEAMVVGGGRKSTTSAVIAAGFSSGIQCPAFSIR